MSDTVETQSLNTVSEEKCKVIFQGISLGLQRFVFAIKKDWLNIWLVFMVLTTVKLRCDALCNLVQFAQFKKREKHPWMFFTFFKLYKWYQIAQRITDFFFSYLLFDSSPAKAREKKNS